MANLLIYIRFWVQILVHLFFICMSILVLTILGAWDQYAGLLSIWKCNVALLVAAFISIITRPRLKQLRGWQSVQVSLFR